MICGTSNYPSHLAALDGCPGRVDAAAEVVAGVGRGGVGDHQAVVPDHHHVALLHPRKPEDTIIRDVNRTSRYFTMPREGPTK